MPEGTVKWFNQVKGFGFIEQEGGDDLFVHKSQVEGIIRDGDTVEFEVGEGLKGPNAVNVRKIGDSIVVEKGPMKSEEKLYTSCEKSKPDNAWPKGTFDDDDITICGKCAKKKIEKKKIEKKKIISSIVEEEGIVPFNYISENLSENKDSLLEQLDNGDSLLVYCLKSRAVIPFSPKELLNNLLTSFPDCSVEPLGWPETSLQKSGMSTHPLMNSMIHSAVTVIPKGSDSLECMKVDELKELLRAHGLPVSGRKSELIARLSTRQQNSSPIKEAFISVLAKAVHEKFFVHFPENQRAWTILGDETGGFLDYRQGKQYEQYPHKNSVPPSSMLWVVIPPKSHTQVPLMHPYYHATDERFEEETKAAISTLANNENIMCFVFSYDSGMLSDNLRGMAKMEHLAMWQFSLPLVLEKVSQLVTEGDQIDIFVERVDPLVPGIESAALVQEFLGGLSGRSGWGNMVVRDSPVVAKNPLEHGWLGYPDVLGHILWGMTDKYGQKTRGDITRLQEHWTKVPFRQDSLNGCIIQALKDTARPLVFLKSLAAISHEDMRDYIEPFFSGAIREALSSLNQGQWQDLLEHMDSSSKSKQGQNATILIQEFVQIEKTVDNLSNDSDKFDFLLAMLGTSNHIGAITQAHLCKVKIEQLIEGGFKPRPNRMMKYKNLSGGSQNNKFDFSHIEEELVLPEDITEIDDESARYFGAQAQSKALRAQGNDWDGAWEIEDTLLKITTNQKVLNRRWVLRSELQMDQGNYDKARESLEVKLPSVVSGDDASLREGFNLAALLKACTLSGADSPTFVEYSKSVPSALSEYHPSQRIAYWCVRWANDVGKTSSPIVEQYCEHLIEQCCEHLINLMALPQFSHDAAGVILACELLDLKSRGIIDIDIDSFMEIVLNNSAESTREWVDNHPPNEDDWLAPLNFNYR